MCVCVCIFICECAGVRTLMCSNAKACIRAAIHEKLSQTNVFHVPSFSTDKVRALAAQGFSLIVVCLVARERATFSPYVSRALLTRERHAHSVARRAMRVRKKAGHRSRSLRCDAHGNRFEISCHIPCCCHGRVVSVERIFHGSQRFQLIMFDDERFLSDVIVFHYLIDVV